MESLSNNLLNLIIPNLEHTLSKLNFVMALEESQIKWKTNPNLK